MSEWSDVRDGVLPLVRHATCPTDEVSIGKRTKNARKTHGNVWVFHAFSMRFSSRHLKITFRAFSMRFRAFPDTVEPVYSDLGCLTKRRKISYLFEDHYKPWLFYLRSATTCLERPPWRSVALDRFHCTYLTCRTSGMSDKWHVGQVACNRCLLCGWAPSGWWRTV